jgi:S-adenosylmethionine:tRNA ribosyltransferase-isomerase
VRTLESIRTPSGDFRSGEGETNLFIYPGYRFKAVDALLTNFHWPDSTPLLLASAFFNDKAKRTEPFALRPAYEEAIRSGYRFYSYGDAMLLL